MKRGATMYITERNGGLSRITSARHTTKEDMKHTQNEGMLAVKGRRTVKYKLCYTRSRVQLFAEGEVIIVE